MFISREKITNVCEEKNAVTCFSFLENEKIFFAHKLNPKKDKNLLFMEHFHNAYEIIYIVNGKVKYAVEDKAFILQKHDVIFTRPNTYHYIETMPDCEYERLNILLTTNKKYDSICKQIPLEMLVFNCADKPIILQIFSKMNYYVSSFPQDVALTILQNLCEELLYNFSLFKSTELLTPKNHSPLIQEALSYIKDNLYTITDIEEITRALFVSKSHLFKCFKDELKISPKKYILMLRLHWAHTLIATGEKASVVYLKCGFSSYNTFYKSFLAYYGYSPSATHANPNNTL